MPEIGNIFVRIGARFDELDAALRQVDKAIEQAEKRFQGLADVGERLESVGMRLSLVGAGMAAGIGYAVKTVADFEAQMSKVRALSGATEEEFQRLQDAAVELGAKTVYSASEAAEGMQILAAAGFNTEQIIAAMPGLLDAAASSGEGFATVADIMVAAMSGFGLQAQDMAHIADVLASAANASAISITDIGYSLKYVAPIAATAGVSIEEVSAALAILGNAGIKAEQAGTTLRMAFIRLADPPKEAAEALKSLGIRTTDAQGRMLPLGEIIAQLSERFRGLSEAEQIQAASAIFGAHAVSGMMALIKAGPQALADLTTSFQQSSGAAREMASIMTDNLAGAWEQLKGAVESRLIRLGDALAPAIRQVTEALTRLVEWFNNLPGPVQKAIAVGGALAAVLTTVAGATLTLAGLMMQGVPAIMAVVGAIGKLGPVLAGLAGPVGIAVAAIGAVIAIGTVLCRHWDEIKAWLSRTWESIKARAVEIWTGLKEWLVNWWPYLIGALAGPVGIFAAWVYKNWDAIKQQAVEAWNRIKEAVLERVRTWVEIGTRLAEGISQGLQNAKEWLKARVIEWAKAVLPDPLERLLGIASPSALMAYYGQMVAEGLARGMEGGRERVRTAAESMAQAISGAVSAVQERVSLASDIISARFELMAAQMGANVPPAQALQLELQKLQQQLALTQEHAQVLAAAYERMKAVKGETATETQKLYLELLRAQIAQVGLAKSIAEVNERLKEQSAALDERTRKLAAQAEAIQRSVWGKYLTSKGIQEALRTGALTVADLQQVVAALVRGAVGAEGVRALFEKLRATYYEAPLERVKEMFRRMYGLEPPSFQGGGVVLGSRPVLATLHPPEAVVPLDRGELFDPDALARAIAQHLKPSVHLETHVHSPEPLSPSEVARRNRQMLRELALEWGLV